MARLFLAIMILMAGSTSELSAASESSPPEFEAQSDGLVATAKIRRIDINSENDYIAFHADVRISNTSGIAKRYSNSGLFLTSCGGLRVRAHSNSNFSKKFDESSAEIPPNETLELELYWEIPVAECEDDSDYPSRLILAPQP